MRPFDARPADVRDLEHGCVEWFDYERHATRRGRLGRPRGPRDCGNLQRHEEDGQAAIRAPPAGPTEV